jgi:galactose mutarotase-like enzyme
MIPLENDHLKIWIKPKGAELKSLVNKSTGIDHIWNADPTYWAKSSPILFPIVGGLKDDTYFFEGNSYALSRHGFARENMFEVESKSSSQVTFVLNSSFDTLKVYPFHFQLKVSYTINENELKVSYEVINTGKSDMYFSLGAHPAFAVPFESEEGYNNYFLDFENDIALNIWPLTIEGLIESQPVSRGLEDKTLALSKELFENDALVLKDLKSECITLKSKMSPHGLKFNFKDFPYFGIWAAKNANFVCLEPWCGIADSESHNQELAEKEGINKLETDGLFERTWSVEVF